MKSNNPPSLGKCAAFAGNVKIATGSLAEVAIKVKKAGERKSAEPLLVFDDETAAVVDLDLRGTRKQIIERYSETARCKEPAAIKEDRGRGRPKLGVVGREVTLLPRHWDWLSEQPGGPSVTIRKLVEEARRTSQGKDRIRRAKEGAYRFMNAMAGNLPGFEEAARVLFGASENRSRTFESLTTRWPADIREHALLLLERVDAAEAADRAGE